MFFKDFKEIIFLFFSFAILCLELFNVLFNNVLLLFENITHVEDCIFFNSEIFLLFIIFFTGFIGSSSSLEHKLFLKDSLFFEILFFDLFLLLSNDFF